MKKESITNVFSIMLVLSGILVIIWWHLLGLSQMLSMLVTLFPSSL